MKGNDYVKCAEDFRTIYNNAWAKGHFNFKPMSKEMGMNIMKKLKPIADKKIMLLWLPQGPTHCHVYYDSRVESNF
jgi:hypothetical protein